MRAILLLLFGTISTISISSFGQKNKKETEKYYVFDKDWKGTTVDKAVYMIYVQPMDDTTWQWNYYNYLGPLLYIQSYRSEESEIPHGYHAYFNKHGKIDSAGNYHNGKRAGEWYYYGDSLTPQSSFTYTDGKITKEWKKTIDTAKNTPADPNEKEAEFKNGLNGWKKYLVKNLSYPARAENSGIHGMLQISFIVDTDGKIIQPRIIKSVEFSIDQEGIRVIRQSPAWQPAFQSEKNVKAYHHQPLTF